VSDPVVALRALVEMKAHTRLTPWQQTIIDRALQRDGEVTS
jgi:hypothetical protein